MSYVAFVWIMSSVFWAVWAFATIDDLKLRIEMLEAEREVRHESLP